VHYLLRLFFFVFVQHTPVGIDVTLYGGLDAWNTKSSILFEEPWPKVGEDLVTKNNRQEGVSLAGVQT
jgi:hypothetical protein